MRLSELSNLTLTGMDPEITGLTEDSRRVKPGYVFAALPGTKTDGRQYIDDAIRHGAAAILAAADVNMIAEVPILAVENPRATLAHMAARFYKAQPCHIAAVTGTNGKTSTVHFAQQLWQALGYKAASLGTLGLRGVDASGAQEQAGSMTTPDAVFLMAILADLAAAGVDRLAMEASSHGLSQYRLDGVRVGAAGFTNLTRDHLDYHNDMGDYFAAKQRLFNDVLLPGGIAVLNADVPEYGDLKAAAAARGIRIIDYGRNADVLKIETLLPAPQGQSLKLKLSGKVHELDIPLVGPFMVMNALCALGLVMAEAPDDAVRNENLVSMLTILHGAPGRLQPVPGHPRGAVYVDYAHTPDALENILHALRLHTKNRLICVIGCGGDRDAGKRPVMGRVAATLSDVAIITDDNPRSEDPAAIRAAMIAAASGAIEIAGRRAAIRHAVEMLQTGDILVIAGKGHERGQIIGNKIEPFDDIEEAMAAMTELKRKKA